MNIRDKLSVQFSLIVISILIVFTVVIYFFSENYRSSDYYERLDNKARSTAELLFNVDEVDEPLLKIIDKNTLGLYQERILILNEKKELLYYNPPILSDFKDTLLFDTILDNNDIKIQSSDNREILGINIQNKGSKYVIIISAFDKYGYSKLHNLRIVLILGLLFCAIMTIGFGYFFASRALSPMSGVISQVNNITISNLNDRVFEGNQKDEIAVLAITFNKMLDRIEDAFLLQREFVSNAAHELRTPFAVLLAEIDFTLNKERESKYYVQALTNLNTQIKKLSRLSNGLLDLAQISMDQSAVSTKKIRIDELLVETCNQFMVIKPDVTIKVDFGNMPENDQYLYIYGNEQLLAIAFNNLIDNARKFSKDKFVSISLYNTDKIWEITFEDKGIGIPKDEVEKIFQPFFRGKNAHYTSGYGIGLALTKKIIDLHKGEIIVLSEVDKGSQFIIKLPFA